MSKSNNSHLLQCTLAMNLWVADKQSFIKQIILSSLSIHIPTMAQVLMQTADEMTSQLN